MLLPNLTYDIFEIGKQNSTWFSSRWNCFTTGAREKKLLALTKLCPSLTEIAQCITKNLAKFCFPTLYIPYFFDYFITSCFPFIVCPIFTEVESARFLSIICPPWPCIVHCFYIRVNIRFSGDGMFVSHFWSNFLFSCCLLISVWFSINAWPTCTYYIL